MLKLFFSARSIYSLLYPNISALEQKNILIIPKPEYLTTWLQLSARYIISVVFKPRLMIWMVSLKWYMPIWQIGSCPTLSLMTNIWRSLNIILDFYIPYDQRTGGWWLLVYSRSMPPPPPKGGVSNSHSTWTIVTGLDINVEKHCKLPVGQYGGRKKNILTE